MTITALAWFVFDLVTNYPFQTAIVILSLYMLSSINWVLSKFFGRTPNAPQPPPPRRQYYDNRDGAPMRNGAPYQQTGGELNALTNRIDGMERRTDLLNNKLEELSRTMERVLENMDDD